MIEIAPALSSISTLVSLARTAIEARDDAKAKQAIADVMQKLLDLNISALQLSERLNTYQSTNADLVRQIQDLETQIKDRAKHRLTPLGTGSFAYALLDESGQGLQTPPVYLCQHCYDKGVRSILRDFAGGEWSGAQWYCIEDDKHSIYK